MARGGCDGPNVLFIICDDLNNAVAGMGRRPCAPAPSLQRLMRQGVRFTNAHSNCPICLPSRNSLFSGLCQAPVSLIDLYPTLADLCGLPAEPHAATHGCHLDGHTLRPLLEDPGAGTWGGPPVALSSVRGDTGIHHSARSATHRYTLCQNGEEELYDHRTDPHEWHNLAADPQHASARQALRRELLRLVWGD